WYQNLVFDMSLESMSAAQKQTSPLASLGSSGTTTAAKPVLTHVSSPSATSGAVVAPSPSTKSQGSQPTDRLTTQGTASSSRPGSTGTSVTPSGGSQSLTTSKTSLAVPPGSTDKVSEATTTSAPGADQSSHSVGPTSAKAPSGMGEQPVSSSPGHQHPNTSARNELICRDQDQSNKPTMYLKKAKSCADWRMASTNISFFESFCSTAQHTFNASAESCRVTLTSPEPHSHHWALEIVLCLTLDPEKVLKELKEKDKLEELGIANITSDKMEREMIINDEFSTPLIITIVTLAGSLLLIATIYGCCHQRFSQKKDQHIHPDLPGFDDGHVALIFNQRLTEELQTMENGYHDNPTLEVMETSSEMQEKKVNLNGELGDSWIVPLDTLMKEDLEEEEDTHL
ncbi:PREDICTED: podocalyxin, partial [Acanthisitta chloris]|uniref:podocalyxin n=1 Tax=Acanthisitta chloris TaxID=57068 RepID=UPI0004F0F083